MSVMQTLSSHEEFEGAQRELNKRRQEFRAAQSSLIQAEERYRKACKAVAKEMGYVGAHTVTSDGKIVND